MPETLPQIGIKIGEPTTESVNVVFHSFPRESYQFYFASTADLILVRGKVPIDR